MADWIGGNFPLTIDQMKINATYIRNVLITRGWTVEAISGMLGNAQSESTINPGRWQSGDEGNVKKGFGLVQWTPASKLIDWANSIGVDYHDMDTQLDRFKYELDNREQYYKTVKYPLTFSQYMESTASPYYLACAWLYNYERPKEYHPEIRGPQGDFWYEYLTGEAPPPKPPIPTVKTGNMPVYMMLRKG